jgi:hypothetical protein
VDPFHPAELDQFHAAAIKLFDTGLALAMQKGAVAVLPAVLGALDVWAGLALLRAAPVSPASPAD